MPKERPVKQVGGIGIDRIEIVYPSVVITADVLAKGIEKITGKKYDVEKIRRGIGVEEIRWPSYSESNITMAAEALYNLLYKIATNEEDWDKLKRQPLKAIGFHTESGTDWSSTDLTMAICLAQSLLATSTPEDRYNKIRDMLEGAMPVPVTFACAGGGISINDLVLQVKNANGRGSAILVGADTSVYEESRAEDAQVTEGSAAHASWITSSPSLVRVHREGLVGVDHQPEDGFRKFGKPTPTTHKRGSQIMFHAGTTNARRRLETALNAYGESIYDGLEAIVSHTPHKGEPELLATQVFKDYYKLKKPDRWAKIEEEIGKEPLPEGISDFGELVKARRDKASQIGVKPSKLSDYVSECEEIIAYQEWLRKLKSHPECIEFRKEKHVPESLVKHSVSGNSYSVAWINSLTSLILNMPDERLDMDDAAKILLNKFGSSSVSLVTVLYVVATADDKRERIGIKDTPRYVMADPDDYGPLHAFLSTEADERMVGRDLVALNQAMLKGQPVPNSIHIKTADDRGNMEFVRVDENGKVEDIQLRY
ncbi:MAG: hypothetical protein KGH98_02810 [Candidatus Micrarchaeota archaeon]|nr:hypothetical protein [Candidatus Micrarchaeota archaeon]